MMKLWYSEKKCGETIVDDCTSLCECTSCRPCKEEEECSPLRVEQIIVVGMKTTVLSTQRHKVISLRYGSVLWHSMEEVSASYVMRVYYPLRYKKRHFCSYDHFQSYPFNFFFFGLHDAAGRDIARVENAAAKCWCSR